MFDCLLGNVTRRVFYCGSVCAAENSDGVCGTDDPSSPRIIEDVGVDHRRLDVLVAEQLLNSADVVAGHQQMSGEGMPHGVAADPLVDPGVANGLFDRAVDHGVVEMVSADDPGLGIGAAGCGTTLMV